MIAVCLLFNSTVDHFLPTEYFPRKKWKQISLKNSLVEQLEYAISEVLQKKLFWLLNYN